jgi:AAA ATPase domain
MLRGRAVECGVLDGLLAEVRAGRSRVLVVGGEPGIGKTALLGYAAGAAADFRVARAGGVESEMELPFAALQQLCGRMLGRAGALPGPQRDALGWRSGCVRAARRTGSWSAWRCWACCRRWPRAGRCCGVPPAGWALAPRTPPGPGGCWNSVHG